MQNKNLTIAIGAIVVLFGVIVIAYGASTMICAPPQGGLTEDEHPWAGGAMPSTLDKVEMATALQHYEVASGDDGVKGWMSDKGAACVASISSDFCKDGLSESWTITYGSDNEQMIVYVENDAVTDLVKSGPSKSQGIEPAALIDSVKAWQLATAAASPGSPEPEVSSMTLRSIGGRPSWDISYTSDDGFRIVRLDATSGQVTNSTVIKQG
jgi:hypothetical protein